jgi:hypothetical protein
MADYYFNNINTGNTDWNDSSNWWTGPNGSGDNVSVPSPNISEDALYFETNCDTNIPTDLSYNITIQSGVTFTIINDTNHADGFYINVSGTLNLNAIFSGYNITVNNGGACIITSNTYFYSSTSGIISSGANINVAGATLFLEGYYINNAINVVSNGSIQYSNCTIVTGPSIASGSTMFINNSIVSTNLTNGINTSLSLANCNIAPSFTITNNGSMSVAGCSGLGSLINSGGCTITGSIVNATFINNSSCTVDNAGSIAATLFTNNATCIVNSGGTLNPVTFTNNGTTTINNGSMNINSSSVYTNNGTFNFGSSYSTAFKGRIFPQVPSSASWGNALL